MRSIGHPSRFDALLLLMAVAMFGGVSVGLFTQLPLRTTVAFGGLLATLGLVDGLLVHPPSP